MAGTTKAPERGHDPKRVLERLRDRQHMAHEVVRVERLLLAVSTSSSRATAEAKRLVSVAYRCDVRTVGNALLEFREEAERMQQQYLAILRDRGRL